MKHKTESQALAGNADRLLRIEDVAAVTTLSKSCLRLWVAQKRFPPPVALSSTVSVWRLSQILAWIDAQFETVTPEAHEADSALETTGRVR
jgi:prophage regulatory protein